MSSALLLAAVMALVGPQDASAVKRPPITLERCLVSVIDKVDIPAQATGLVVKMNVTEGAVVEAEASLGQIDDGEAQVIAEIRAAELAKAKEQVKNDVNTRYAKAAALVAQADYEAAEQANRKVKGAVQETEMRSRQLIWKKTELEIEQAEFEAALAARDLEARDAQLRQAKLDVERRKVTAPLAGMIVETHKRAGEWANAGDLLFRLVRLDKLRVEGFVKAAEYDPPDVDSKPVAVRVTLAGNRQAMFAGRIVFVDPILQQPGGIYKVWAEVVNRQENGHWLLRPGHQVRMDVEVEKAIAAAASEKQPGEKERGEK